MNSLANLRGIKHFGALSGGGVKICLTYLNELHASPHTPQPTIILGSQNVAYYFIFQWSEGPSQGLELDHLTGIRVFICTPFARKSWLHVSSNVVVFMILTLLGDVLCNCVTPYWLFYLFYH